jgi:hypothetical protein
MRRFLAGLGLAIMLFGAAVYVARDPCYDPESKTYDCACIDSRCWSMCGGNVKTFDCNPTSGAYSCACR